MSEIKHAKDDKVKTISSIKVAKLIDVLHESLILKIESEVGEVMWPLCSDWSDFFIKTEYKDKNGAMRECYDITVLGLKLLVDSTPDVTRLNPLRYLYEDFSKGMNEIILINYKKDAFIYTLEGVLSALGLMVERRKPVLEYEIDAYIPGINVAIEYAEVTNPNYSPSVEEDRQRNIENELGCTFIRLDERVDHVRNTGIVISRIIARLK